MKFLKLMKTYKWDKNVFDYNNRKIAKSRLLSKTFKQDYGSEFELESLESKKTEKNLLQIHKGKN